VLAVIRRLAILAILLAALAGGGWWNYQRNLAREAAAAGPYHGYSDEQLAALAKAYEGEIEAHRRRYEASQASPRAEARGQLLDEQVRDFERANARGRAIRDAGGDLAEREATLREIHREQSRRGEDPTQVLLRRLTTFE
jgi:hypothetical protein